MASNLQVANTIIQQMGGTGKLRAMVGAHQIMGDDNSVQFKFKGSRKHNICKVILNASDTYTFELWKLNNRTLDFKKTYTVDGVYWDMLIDLFESETGLYLSL